MVTGCDLETGFPGGTQDSEEEYHSAEKDQADTDKVGPYAREKRWPDTAEERAGTAATDRCGKENGLLDIVGEVL